MGRCCRPRWGSVGRWDGRGPRWLVAVVWIALVRAGWAAVYLNKWAVEIAGGSDDADRIAAEYGFRNLGQIGSLENYYLFEQRKLVKRSASPSKHHHFQLKKSPEVIWVEQQSVKRRFKREYKVELDRWKPKLNDPVWPEMWYLNQGARGGHDMNVNGAWQLGYTGKGVVVTILDDGIEHSHSDLRQNYDPQASFDINDNDIDPTPRYDKADENRHGTRCAGEVAAVANNSRCGVGVAFQARIGGVRMLDGDVVDAVEAQALSLNPQHVDIYSASWGPEDSGKLVDGPATLAKEAFVQGVLRGRGGKGSIYVWASGNGGSMSDSCSCDGYANSIYTLSVSSTSEFGTKPWYLEECSSTLATTYSSGENYKERKIVTTDLHDRCIDNHTGTSASAPLAAGMCALALEANPNLTWRDMQHIVLMTSRSEPLRDAQWVVNGVGRPVSHRYGYGLMDGQAMVLLAEKWTTVPEQRVCTTDVLTVNQEIEGSGISVTFDADGCKDSTDEINYLEHVQARISLAYSRRGDLQIHLVSPNGTRSTLLPRRKYDYQPGEFRNWSFMSVFYWGEQPRGTWTLVLENVGLLPNSGTFEKWQLVMYGTKEDPVSLNDTTPTRPIVNVPAQGESTTGFDTVTVSGLNVSESDRLKPTSTRYRPGITSSRQKPPKPGSRTTTKQAAKGKKTTPRRLLSPTAKVTPSTRTLAPKVNTTLQEQGHLTSQKTLQSVTTVPLAGTTAEEQAVNICDVECTADGCFGPGPESCFVCRYARYDNRCVSSCPSSTFYDSESGSCHPCRFPCVECTGSFERNEQSCISCRTDYLLSTEGNSTTCVELCPVGLYPDVNRTRCLPCVPNCLVCVDDATNCLRCEDDFEFVNSACTEACDVSEYRDEDGSCQSCDVSCKTCIGPDAMDCLTCAPDTLHENDLCVANCSEGYYHDMDQMCEMCHPSCSTCFGSEDDECFSCFHPLKLFGLSCVDECPAGHFEDNDEMCHICHESCSACIGPRENDCMDCPPTKFYFDGRCADNCSEGLFPIELFNHVTKGLTNRCEVCHGTCRTCSGGSPVDCIRCFKGLVLSSGRCIGSCEPHKYKEGDQCLDCHDSCAACYGPLSDHCLECQSDRSLLGSRCLTGCPQGYYRMDGQCLFCSIECNECTDYGADNCVACSSGYALRNGFCVIPLSEFGVSCSRQQFFNAAEQKCVPCHDSCRTCTGSTEHQCLSCLRPKVLHAESGRCLPCCSDVDSSQDVAQCCTCNRVIGICVDVWDNLRPEATRMSNVLTSSLPGNVTPSVISSFTSRVHPSSRGTPLFPSSDPFSTVRFPFSRKRIMPTEPAVQTIATSAFDRKAILDASPVTDMFATKRVEITKADKERTRYAFAFTSGPPLSRAGFGRDVTHAASHLGFWSPWVIAVFVVVCLGTVCAVALTVVFCVVRAKASDKLCWSKRHYHPVPIVCHGTLQPVNSAGSQV